MEIFDRSRDASDRFLQWQSTYPESFVLNIRGKRCMLHRASCGHFAFTDYATILFAPKLGSHNKDELEAWVRAQRGTQYTVCSDCKP